MEDKEKKRLEIKRRLLAEKILEVNKRRQEILNNEVLKIYASNK